MSVGTLTVISLVVKLITDWSIASAGAHVVGRCSRNLNLHSSIYLPVIIHSIKFITFRPPTGIH